MENTMLNDILTIGIREKYRELNNVIINQVEVRFKELIEQDLSKEELTRLFLEHLVSLRQPPLNYRGW